MFINLILQLIFGFIMENELRFKKMALLYLITGIGGTLVATVATDSYAAGPTASVYGLLGGTIGWYIFNWEKFEHVYECTFGERLCRFILLILIVVVVFMVEFG